MTTYNQSEKQYAERENCDVRTVRNWKREGAPLDDPEALDKWKAGRKNLPPGTQTRTVLGHHADGTTEEFQIIGEPDRPTEKTGAAGALTRLETMEVAAYERMSTALATNDHQGAKNAREDWLKISESLRRYDLQIEENRRSSGELYPRAALEKILRALAFYLRISGQQAAAAVATEICAMKEPWQVNQALYRVLWENLMNGFAQLAGQSEGDTAGKDMAVPLWAVQALASDLDFVLNDVPETVKKRAEAIQKLIEHNAKATVRSVKGQ